MNQELKKAVAEQIYRSVTAGKDPEQAAELAIETVGRHLLQVGGEDFLEDVIHEECGL